MINWKNVMGILCAVSLTTVAPNAPAKAQDIGGIIGAMIMNQMMHGGRYHASRHHATRAKSGESGEATNSKDPFAGASAPAGYAKPVNSK